MLASSFNECVLLSKQESSRNGFQVLPIDIK